MDIDLVSQNFRYICRKVCNWIKEKKIFYVFDYITRKV